MGRCLLCSDASSDISTNLGVCLNCIREDSELALQITRRVHSESRAAFNLPAEPPRDDDGQPCGICANGCRIPEGESGFCGLVQNVANRLVRRGGTIEAGVLEWYYDKLPTNCVNWWFCPNCTGEVDAFNLAVFYGACNYDCLYCQNWHHRCFSVEQKTTLSAAALSTLAVKEKVACICFFGGDPSPQMPHSLEVSRIILEKAEAEDRTLRLCWETNGAMDSKLAEKAWDFTMKSGGNLKFDLKAWSEALNIALCGVTNNQALDNFRKIGKKLADQNLVVPSLSASTLLVSGYVDAIEVERIASFISAVDRNTPYTLLAFYPASVMHDLPATSRKQALECRKAAEKHLNKVTIGNAHLLI